MKHQLISFKKSFNLSGVVSLFNIHVIKRDFTMTAFLKKKTLKIIDDDYEKKNTVLCDRLTLTQNNCHNCGKTLKNVPTLNCNFKLLQI